jgi:hypothetical protein
MWSEKLWMELAKERAHLDADCKEDKVERHFTWCYETLRSVLNNMAMIIRISATQRDGGTQKSKVEDRRLKK